ncbi:MAG: CHAT domain-containing protein [Calothrix sp. MO_192.B10]|nr:CHAT domain-containing protein [Calothrix sp. MO_192.B10]
MKRLVSFLLVATLGLILSLGVSVPFTSTAQPNAQTQTSPVELVQTGKQYYDAGQFVTASKIFSKAAKIYQVRGNSLQQAQVLSFLSLAQQKLSNFTEATKAINTSIAILDTLETGKKVDRVRAQVLNAQGHLQLAQGKPEAALQSWRDGEKLYQKANNIAGIIGSQINQSQALHTLGLYRQTYKLLTQIEQKLAGLPDSPLKVIGLQNLGNILRQRGELERSQQLLESSLGLAQKLSSSQPSSFPESSLDRSKIILSLANTKLALGRRAETIKDKQAAKKYIQSALNYYQQTASITTSPITKTQAQLNQLSLLIDNQDWVSVKSLLPPVNQNIIELPASRESVYAQINFGESLMKLSSSAEKIASYSKITQILNTAIKQAQYLQDKRAESYALGTLGKLYEKKEQWAKAEKITQSALLIAQGINAPDIAYQLQWQMGRVLQNQQKSNSQAITYYTQAFNNLNTLRSDLAVLNPEIQFSFREKVEPVYREFVELLLRSPTPSKENLIQARDVIESLQLAELDNFFRDACAKPVAVNIDNLDANAAVIYPIILENRLEVIVKLPGVDNLRHYVNQDVSVAQVDEITKQIQTFLIKASTSPKKIKQAAKQIYDWLIQPFASELETAIERNKSNIKTLVFVLDGSLQNIPLSILYDGNKYLIERYAITVTPGLQLLAPKPLRKKQINALIAGTSNAPSFAKEGLSPLSNVAFELAEVSKEINRSQKLENKEFSQETIQKKINSAAFNIVHIATHGKFSSNPDETYILDWNKRINIKDWDSLLQIKDFNKQTTVELLVLSACETATGDKRAALGLAGVAIRAGASSTLATLWQVDDASTAEFMIQFYKQLINNPQISKAEAVRNVQLAFLQDYPDIDYNRPYYWAPFILVGNWL